MVIAMKIYNRKRKRYKKYMVRFVIVLFSAAAMLLFGLLFVNSRIMPAVLETAKIHSQHRVNHAINEALNDFTMNTSLVSSDFYHNSIMPAGFSVNTVLINQIGSRLATDISDLLIARQNEKIPVPLGMVTGIDMIAALGPNINVRVIPIGSAIVDFETSFASVGINQVNFQVWLNIELTVGLVTPLQSRLITMTRRVALVDTVYQGEIPYFYVAPR